MLTLLTWDAELSKGPRRGKGYAFIDPPLHGEILGAVGDTASGRRSQWDEAALCSWCRFQRGCWVGAERHSQITEWHNTVPSLPSEELPSTDHFLCPANTNLFTYVLSSDRHSNTVGGYCCFSHSADKKLRLREAKSWPVTVARTVTQICLQPVSLFCRVWLQGQRTPGARILG